MQQQVLQLEDDDEDQEKWRTRQSTGFRKSHKSKRGHGRRHLDARQYTMFIGGCFLICWGLVATFLLLRLGIMYTFDTITITRQDYGTKGSAALAKARASQDVAQALDVWNIVNASVVGLVYREPQDYANLLDVLSSAFESMPTLHSVDLAFTDRTSEVTVTRQKVEIGSSSHMQSNADDCYLIGIDGCGGTSSEISRQPDWYFFGSGLQPTAYGGAYAWAPVPQIIVESNEDGTDLLSPSIRLIFQATFPSYHSAGIRAKVIGRITVKVAGLGGNLLADDKLGDESTVYLCDATGVMLASQDWGDLLTVDGGQVRYKYFWEVSPEWAPRVRDAFTGSSVREKVSDEDGSLIVVEPLDEPLNRFGVIIVSPSFVPFRNAALIGTAALASIVAPAPYVIVASIGFILFCAQCFHSMRANDGKVGVEAMDQRKRVSITATMNRVTVSNKPGEGNEKEWLPPPKRSSSVRLTHKVRKMATFMQRGSTKSRSIL